MPVQAVSPSALGSGSAAADGTWRIGRWLFDGSRHVLRRDGEERRIEPKAAAVLAALARRPGRLRTRDELLAAAWPGLHVGEEVLTNAVYELRRALGDDVRRPRYIETIPTRGYRLVAATSAVAARRSRWPRFRGGRWAAVLAILIGVAGAWHWAATRNPGSARAGSAASLAAARHLAIGWDAIDGARPGASLVAMEAAGAALAADPGAQRAWALAGAAWAG